MQIVNSREKDAIKNACEALDQGKLVIFPTETCYGIAADATNTQAITSLFTYKGDRHRQVSIAVANREMAEKYVEINEVADNLYKNFLPGPVTVISRSRGVADERLESVEGTLGIRIPDHNFALELIRIYSKPITATSANTSGKKEPYSLADWQKYTTPAKQQMVSIFLDGGRLVERPTSTVVDTTLNEPEVLRQGEIALPSSAPSYLSHSPEETQQFACSLIRKYMNLLHKYPLFIALQGELGAGKTQFSKGIATALGVSDTVASPTYTLLHEYPYTLPKYAGVFYHIDTWRLPDMTELESTLHFSTLLAPGNIIAMEWAGKAKDTLEQYKNDYPILVIDIKELDDQTRKIMYNFSTPEWS